jgi:Holliday junction resolvase RusA-like endonuclease
MICNITPVAKPRQTRADKWKKRPCVMKYRAFADEVREKGIDIPESGCHIIFGLPMPGSWSKKKKAKMDGKPHQVRPDWDNLAKAVCDAIFEEDSHIWDIRISKVWAEKGHIKIYGN